MNKIFAFLFLLVVFTAAAFAQTREADFVKIWCLANNGVIEAPVGDRRRVDCLTEDFAVEFDFGPKWAECVGQALYYGKKTNRIPVCALIYQGKVKQNTYKKYVDAVNLIDEILLVCINKNGEEVECPE